MPNKVSELAICLQLSGTENAKHAQNFHILIKYPRKAQHFPVPGAYNTVINRADEV